MMPVRGEQVLERDSRDHVLAVVPHAKPYLRERV
jgi:hypothetical protein